MKCFSGDKITGYRMARSRHKHRLAELRAAAGLTLRQVADRCRPPTTGETINRLELGRQGLTIEWMYRLAPAFHVRPWDFFSEMAPMEPKDQILALWPQLAPERRAELLRELARSIAPDVEAPGLDIVDDTTTPDEGGVQRFLKVEVTDRGTYSATVYYRPRSMIKPNP
jgi:transcriptional regulator with XRE-family HTH domain